MANYEITLTVEAARKESVEKALVKAFGKEVPLYSVEKLKSAESRSDRLAEAEGSVEDAKNVVSELKDEMQNWLDSIPENLQQGSKASEVQEALDALESLESDLENVQFDVNFPGMF